MSTSRLGSKSRGYPKEFRFFFSFLLSFLLWTFYGESYHIWSLAHDLKMVPPHAIAIE